MTTYYDRDCCFRRSTQDGLPRVLWELNTTCNLACGFCHASPHTDRGLSTQAIREWLEILARTGIQEIIFSGGEPLLRRDCLYILGAANQTGMRVDLCTNATLVTAPVAAQLRNCLAEISVSLDSADPALHNRLRGQPWAWERAVRGIRRLVDTGLEVHAITLVSDQTAAGLEATVQLLAELGVQSVTLLGLVPVAGHLSNDRFRESTRLQLAADLPGLRRRNPGITINTKRITAMESEDACGAGRNIWGLTASGDLVPCILLQGSSRGLSMSDLKTVTDWQEVNFLLKQLNPGPLWQRCASQPVE